MISDGEAETAAKRKGRGYGGKWRVRLSLKFCQTPGAPPYHANHNLRTYGVKHFPSFPTPHRTRESACSCNSHTKAPMPHNLGEQTRSDTLPGRHTTAEGDGPDSMTDAKPLGRLYLRDEVQVLLPGVSPRVDAVPRRHGVQAHVARELHCRLDKLVDHLGRHHLSCAKCRDRLSKRRQLQS